MGCGPSGSSVHGIFQTKILEWVAMPHPQGIFPTQRSNLGLLHLLPWQADSLHLVQPGKSISVITRKIQIKTTIRYHLTPIRMATFKEIRNNKCFEDVEKRESLCPIGGIVYWYSHYKQQYEVV